jgi:hypothetical protein
MGARRQQSVSFPQTKISETFLSFASPLSDAVGEGITKEQLERILQIAFTVWNAVVFDTVRGNSTHVSHIRRLTAGNPMEAKMIENLIRRKQEEFADDHRLIGEYALVLKNGEWILRAEARDPTRTGGANHPA